MQQRENETVTEALTHIVLSLNSNINRQSIQNALKHSDLSWKLFKAENKQFLMERLQNMLKLSKVQSLDVYDSMKGMVPHVLDGEIRENIHRTYRMFYKGFLLQCMLCSVL